MGLISCVSTPGYTLIKAGSSCYNSNGQHPPFAVGNEAANSLDNCASKCKERAQATGKTCTGFGTRSGCLFYYDEPVTQPKLDGLPGDCYNMDVPQGISPLVQAWFVWAWQYGSVVLQAVTSPPPPPPAAASPSLRNWHRYGKLQCQWHW